MVNGGGCVKMLHQQFYAIVNIFDAHVRASILALRKYI